MIVCLCCLVGPPQLTQIIIDSDDVSVIPGDNGNAYVYLRSKVSGTCSGVAIPPALIRWTKDGEILQSAGRYQVTASVLGAEITSILVVSDVETDDGGVYQCTIASPYGSDGVALNFVPVAPMAPIINRQLENETPTRTANSVTVRVGPQQILVADDQSLQVFCDARGQPDPTISWRKGDSQVGSSGRVMVDSSGVLVIREFSSTDEGKYTCVATNTQGSDSESINVVRASELIYESVFVVAENCKPCCRRS